MKKELLKVKELADLLRVHPNYIYAEIGKGNIPGLVRVGGAVRFNKQKIMDWISGEDESDGRQ